jgi:hypothetical protein
MTRSIMGIETFASPGLRWGLLLEDHPKATHEFEMRGGAEIGVPDQYGGQGDFCVCTLRIPGQEPIVAYKEAPRGKDPDDWVVACTKTLGRALKKAGYPDDLKDLKALVLWRQRNAEVAAIGAGVALEAGQEKPLEIEAGGRDADDDGKPDVDHDVTDDATSNSDDDVVDAEIVEEPEAPAPAPTPEPEAPATPAEAPAEEKVELNAKLWEQLAQEVSNLTGRDAKEFGEFCSSQSIPTDPNEWTNEDLAEIDAWFQGG